MTVKEFCLVPRLVCARTDIGNASQPPNTATPLTSKDGESYITRIAPQLATASETSTVPTLSSPVLSSFSSCPGGGCNVGGAVGCNALVSVAAQRVAKKKKKKNAVTKYIGDLLEEVPSRGASRSRTVPIDSRPRYRVREPVTSLRRRRTPNPSISHILLAAFDIKENYKIAEKIVEWLERERPQVRWSSDGVFYEPLPGLSVVTFLKSLLKISAKKELTKKEKRMIRAFISVVPIPQHIIPFKLRIETSPDRRAKDEERLSPLLSNLGWQPY